MATWLSGYSRQHRTIRRNAVIWCGIFAAVFLLLGCRLLWLQTVRGHFLQAQAASYINRIEVLAARRGELLDRDHKALALDDTRDSLYVDPEMVDNAAFVAGQLAPVIGRPEQEIVDTITRQLPFIWIKQAIAPTIATTVDSLKLPGVTVQADGARYRVGANPALLPASTGVAAALATAAGMKQATLITALGIPTALPQEQSGPVDPEADMPAKGAPAKHAAKVAKPAPAPVKPLPPPPSEQRWLPGEFNEASANAVQALHFTGVTVEKLGPSFSVGVDPRLYLNHTAPMTADAVADRLAPLLGMTHDAVVRRLLFKPRFAWLYRGLSEEMSNAVQKLQGTFYVLTPGIAASVPLKDEKTADPEARLTAVVERLYKMINPQPKHVKRGQTPEPVVELISHDAIRAKLVAGAAPGPLIEKLDDGRPVLSIIRRLKQEPIPGVVYGLPGVSTKQERRRRYPFSNMASATLGFVGYWNDAFHGAFGLEQSEDKTLRGEDGKIKREIDTHRMSIPESDVMLKAPVNGCNVVTTLSTDIQQVADDELGKAVDATHALRGACVVMDCNTGEILAMATYPNWDANAPGKSTLPLVHTAVSNWYEPGSTFKTMTVLAALEEGTIHDGENVTYCSGALTVGNHTIHEAHGAHGEVDCGRLLEQSCNLGAATLAMKLGPTRFLKWCDRLGFGKPTGVEIANESTGSLNRLNCERAKITLANEGFGQSMAVTPLQMLALYSAVANGGYLVKPHLVSARELPDGSYQPVTTTRTRVCKAETASLMRGYLERVVTKGTGKAAAIPGYRIGGKTGTAQKAGVGGFRPGKYIGSFIGFLPVEKPRLAIVALIDEPQGAHYGGVIAAPVVSAVGRRAMEFLSIPPSKIVTTKTAKPAAEH